MIPEGLVAGFVGNLSSSVVVSRVVVSPSVGIGVGLGAGKPILKVLLVDCKVGLVVLGVNGRGFRVKNFRLVEVC